MATVGSPKGPYTIWFDTGENWSFTDYPTLQEAITSGGNREAAAAEAEPIRLNWHRHSAAAAERWMADRRCRSDRRRNAQEHRR